MQSDKLLLQGILTVK